MTVDDLLRGALRDLADEAHPATDLTGRALHRGRRLRRRRRITAVAATGLVLLATAAATIPYAKTHRTPAPPAVTVVPSPRVVPAPSFDGGAPFEVPGGLVVTSIRDTSGTNSHLEVLDRPSGRYQWLTTTFTSPLLSPDGRFVADVVSGTNQLTMYDSTTFSTSSIDYVDGPAEPQWSPTGDRLLVYRYGGFQVVYPEEGHQVGHDTPDDQRLCLDFCQFTWLADGTGVALPQAHQRGNDPSRVSGIAIFDADTGRLLRTVPVPGAPLGTGAWSPDGGAVLIHPTDPNSSQVLVARTTDGHTVGGLRADQAFFLSDGTIFGQYGATVTHYDATGHPLERMTLPGELATKALTYGRL